MLPQKLGWILRGQKRVADKSAWDTMFIDTEIYKMCEYWKQNLGHLPNSSLSLERTFKVWLIPSVPAERVGVREGSLHPHHVLPSVLAVGDVLTQIVVQLLERHGLGATSGIWQLQQRYPRWIIITVIIVVIITTVVVLVIVILVFVVVIVVVTIAIVLATQWLKQKFRAAGV